MLVDAPVPPEGKLGDSGGKGWRNKSLSGTANGKMWREWQGKGGVAVFSEGGRERERGQMHSVFIIGGGVHGRSDVICRREEEELIGVHLTPPK